MHESKNIEKVRRKGMPKMHKILVAEDDPSLAHYYVILLGQWNCETVVEHTGKDAIQRAATFQPDIALLGVVMPKMSGVEAGIKLLEICNWRGRDITSRRLLRHLAARSCTQRSLGGLAHKGNAIPFQSPATRSAD
jgi:CheY-like chemotaxis protein